MAAVCTYNFRAISLCKAACQRMISPSERNMSPVAVVNFSLMAPHRSYIHSLRFTSRLTFPHLSCLCFMSDTKAFNQQVLIYDSSERCNLRFLVEARIKKNLGVSLLSSHAGTSRSCDRLHPSPSDTQRFRLLYLWCSEEMTGTTPLLLLFVLLHSMSHQMCERTK